MLGKIISRKQFRYEGAETKIGKRTHKFCYNIEFLMLFTLFSIALLAYQE